jgi:glycosyltransferase involved in cell wall biosynthesis
VPAKGQHILVRACDELKRHGIRFHLVFVGDGPDRVSLEARVENLGLQEEISFAGAVGQDKIHRYYDQADVFVLPSFAEGVPVVLMEAMAKEIPVVSTRITGIPELVENHVSGILVPPSDVKALSDAIQTLLSSVERRRILGQNGRKAVLERYDLGANCQTLARLFAELTADNL